MNSEQTELLLQEIRDNEINNPKGTHLQKLMSRFTLNTICGKDFVKVSSLFFGKFELLIAIKYHLESAMGVKLTKIDALDDYRRKINEIGKYQVERLTVPWFISDFLYFRFGNGKLEQESINQAKAFTGNVIASKRKTFIQENMKRQAQNNDDAILNSIESLKKRQAMLDTLLDAEQNHQSIDSAGIQEETDTFVFEGFDTTMTAITFILLSIANHAEVQICLYEEITDSIRDGHQSYNNLKYLDAVIKESLRMWPPVPFIGRVLGEDTILDGFKFPAKTMVHIMIYFLHRDPKFFPYPEKFDPNRFLENEIKHPFAYVPFSAGQRNCIGIVHTKL